MYLKQLTQINFPQVDESPEMPCFACHFLLKNYEIHSLFTNNLQCTRLHTKTYPRNRIDYWKLSAPAFSLCVKCIHLHTHTYVIYGVKFVNCKHLQSCKGDTFYLRGCQDTGARIFNLSPWRLILIIHNYYYSCTIWIF